MRTLCGYDPQVAAWVAQQIPHVGDVSNFGPLAAIGVIDDYGNLAAGAVYHGYMPRFRGIEISFAMRTLPDGRHDPRALSRGVIRALLSYPFDSLNCVRVTAATPRKAEQTRAFLEKLGFKREGVLRYGFGSDHAFLYGLLEREWRRGPFGTRGGLSSGQKGQILHPAAA